MMNLFSVLVAVEYDNDDVIEAEMVAEETHTEAPETEEDDGADGANEDFKNPHQTEVDLFDDLLAMSRRPCRCLLIRCRR